MEGKDNSLDKVEQKRSFSSCFANLKIYSLLRFVTGRLARWHPAYWVFFLVIIPLILCFIATLPVGIKEEYCIFSVATLWSPSFLLHAYTHSTLDHFCGNLGGYLIAMIVIFLCCRDARFLFWSAPVFLVVLPIVTSAATLLTFQSILPDFHSQGFSAIVSAYLALAFWCFLQIPGQLLQEVRESADTLKKRFVLNGCYVLMAIGIILVMYKGFEYGLFFRPDGTFVNGFAHFIGFFTGIFTAVLLDWKWKICDRTLNLWFFTGAIGLGLGCPGKRAGTLMRAGWVKSPLF